VTLEFLPFLLLGLPAGAWIDRMRRRPVLIAADLARGGALATVPLAGAFDVLTYVQLLAVVLIVGIGTVFFEIAHTSYLPALVGREDLLEGNARLATTAQVAEIGGPAAGGALVGAITAPGALVIDAASFLASALFLSRIRVREAAPAPPPPDAARAGRLRGEMRAGVRYVLGHPLLRPIAAFTAVANLAAGMTLAVYILFMRRGLGLDPAVIGLVIGLGNVGGIAGALLARRFATGLGVGRSIVAGLAAATAGQTLLASAPSSAAAPLLIVALALISFGPAIVMIVGATIRQSVTPDHLLGRMNATMRVLQFGTLPIGTFLGGLVASAVGYRATLGLAAAGLAVATVPVLLSPLRSLDAIPTAVDGGPPAAVAEVTAA
jgi:MFS family permease